MTNHAIAAVAKTPDGPFSIEAIELDDLRADEVLVRIEASGICYTDIECKQTLLPTPSVLGHEGAGVVEALGSGVTLVNAGDRVIVSYPYCGTCPNCERHAYYHCDQIVDLKFGGSRLDGSKPVRLNGKPITSAFFQQSSFATYAVTQERNLVVVPPETPFELMAALPCGMLAGAGSILNILDVQDQRGVIVVGAGAVGLGAVMTAKIRGAYPIIAVDVVPARLEMARSLGATHTINALQEDAVAKIRTISPRGIEAGLDTTGLLTGMTTIIKSLARGGKCALVTVPPGNMDDFPMEELFMRAASLHCVFVGAAIAKELLPQLLNWHAEGIFPVDRLIRTFDFKDINLAVASTRSGETIKAVLLMNRH